MNANYIVTQRFEVEASSYRQAIEKVRARQLACTKDGMTYVVEVASHSVTIDMSNRIAGFPIDLRTPHVPRHYDAAVDCPKARGEGGKHSHEGGFKVCRP